MTANVLGQLSQQWKAPVLAAATVPLPANTYAGGVLTATGNGALAVDGVTLPAAARVLAAAEASPANNGVYAVTSPGTPTTPYVLTRAPDMAAGYQVPGAVVLAESGTLNAGQIFAVVSAASYTLGTTAITWTAFSLSQARILAPSGDTTGVTDFNAISGAFGTPIQLLPGKFYINQPLALPSWQVILGSGPAINNSFVADVQSTIVVTSTFTSGLAHGLSAAIALVGPGSSANTYGGQLIRDLQIDLSNAPASVDGILGWSQVDGVIIEDVGIYRPTGHGVHCEFDGVSGLPDGWRMRGILVNQGLARGFSFQAADMEIEDCHAVQCTDGFYWTNLTNSALIGCRSANNSINGYHWQGGAASGYLNMTGCSSDSNASNGLFVDAVTSAGTPILNLTGFSSKNDSGNAVQVSSSSIPVVATGIGVWATAPGTTGPGRGFGFSSVTGSVVITGAYVQAVTDWITASPPPTVTWRNVVKNLGGGDVQVADSDLGLSLASKAATANAGYALVNGTGTVISWTAPNDGVNHRFTVFSALHVTSNETGGTINFACTLPDTTAVSGQLYASGQVAGTYGAQFASRVIAPNTTVTITQASALTVGAATLWAEIWAA